MNARCEPVGIDWTSWALSEAASQAVDIFKMGVAFFAGRFSRRPKPAYEPPPLYVTGGVTVRINPKLSGKVSLDPQLRFNFQ